MADSKLSTYRAKRDFALTKEPSGGGRACGGEAIALRHPEA